MFHTLRLTPHIVRIRYFEEQMPGELTDLVEVTGKEERAVVAKRDIAQGTVIAEESPFVATFKAHAPVCSLVVFPSRLLISAKGALNLSICARITFLCALAVET
jgi:hypothetical protein